MNAQFPVLTHIAPSPRSLNPKGLTLAQFAEIENAAMHKNQESLVPCRDVGEITPEQRAEAVAFMTEYPGWHTMDRIGAAICATADAVRTIRKHPELAARIEGRLKRVSNKKKTQWRLLDGPPIIVGLPPTIDRAVAFFGERPNSTAADYADASGLEYTRARGAIDRAVQKGLIRKTGQLGKLGTYALTRAST